jgi:hypothetical protein
MIGMSGMSGQISAAADLQSYVSGWSISGQVSPGLWERMVGWGKVIAIPGVLLGVGDEIVKLKVLPHLEPPGMVKPIDLGPVRPIMASGTIFSGWCLPVGSPGW